MRHVRVALALSLVAVLLSVVPAGAQTGTVSGTLVEEGTLTPLATDSTQSFTVWVTRTDDDFEIAFRSAQTDSAGHYAIVNLPPGSYYVSAYGTGHVPQLHQSLTYVAADSPLTLGTPVVVTTGGTATVDFTLAKAGSFTGTVRRAANASPIQSLRVAIYNAHTSLVDRSTITDANGTYTVTGLPEGSYYARTTHTFVSESDPIDYVDELYGGIPFGTIDTPLQGQTISGSSYVNFGWALTRQPGIIPTDGSTIQVIVDGVPIGNAAYNFFRPDVSNSFPGLANSGGPVGYRVFDTTALAEGLHTISWAVTDSRPATSGIGSRYFNVANSADAPGPAGGSVTANEATPETADVAMPLGRAPAPDLGRRVESLTAATDPVHSLQLVPMERLELVLDSLVDPDDACAATWAGYLKKNNALTELPVGASLDRAGTFYWQTGPGFAGRFPLVFVRTNCRGDKTQVPVGVTIPIR